MKTNAKNTMALVKSYTDMSDEELLAASESVIAEYPANGAEESLQRFRTITQAHSDALAEINAEWERRKPNDTVEAVAADFAALITHHDKTWLSSSIKRLAEGVSLLERQQYEASPEDFCLMLDLLAGHAEKVKQQSQEFFDAAEKLEMRYGRVIKKAA